MGYVCLHMNVLLEWRCENQILSHDYGINGVELR